MILRIPRVLTADQVRHCRQVLAEAAWVDGRVTAGPQSGLAKRNLQLPEESAQAKILGELVLDALAGNPHFMSATLPLKVYPPLFNLYRQGMGFGDHVDNAIRVSPVSGARYRTDVSCTLFLSDPADYDGGELRFEDGVASVGVKLPAGDMIVYPATTVHRVEPVTQGERWASFFWVQSMTPDLGRRTLLYQMDQAVALTRRDLGDDHAAAVSLTAVYHNLIRMWADA